jgi:Co/Zn/Cd efflux system component
MYFGWSWADPVVGIIGAAVIASWAIGLVRASGSVLLDANSDGKMEGLIRERLETRGDRVTDLHLWQIGPGHRAAIVSLISDDPLPPSQYKRRLSGLHGLSHVTVEVETCRHDREGAC